MPTNHGGSHCSSKVHRSPLPSQSSGLADYEICFASVPRFSIHAFRPRIVPPTCQSAFIHPELWRIKGNHQPRSVRPIDPGGLGRSSSTHRILTQMQEDYQGRNGKLVSTCTGPRLPNAYSYERSILIVTRCHWTQGARWSPFTLRLMWLQRGQTRDVHQMVMGSES